METLWGRPTWQHGVWRMSHQMTTPDVFYYETSLCVRVTENYEPPCCSILVHHHHSLHSWPIPIIMHLPPAIHVGSGGVRIVQRLSLRDLQSKAYVVRNMTLVKRLHERFPGFMDNPFLLPSVSGFVVMSIQKMSTWFFPFKREVQLPWTSCWLFRLSTSRQPSCFPGDAMPPQFQKPNKDF